VGAVPPLKLGIKYNHFNKAADTGVVYQPGRYFIGPFNKFLLFPSVVQTVEFCDEPLLKPSGRRYEALHARSKEGVSVLLQVSLQYRLLQDKVGALYGEFNQNYEQVITSSVRGVLIKATSQYDVNQLWESRATFGANMQSMVDGALRSTYSECWGLQVLVADLPDKFEHRLVLTQVQKQAMLLKEQEQVSAKIRAETSVIQAEFARREKVILAQGRANYTLITKKAQAEAQKRKIHAESEAMGHVKQVLGLWPAGLVLYNKYDALDAAGASLYYGFGGSQLLAG